MSGTRWKVSGHAQLILTTDCTKAQGGMTLLTEMKVGGQFSLVSGRVGRECGKEQLSEGQLGAISSARFVGRPVKLILFEEDKVTVGACGRRREAGRHPITGHTRLLCVKPGRGPCVYGALLQVILTALAILTGQSHSATLKIPQQGSWGGCLGGAEICGRLGGHER